ncbi:hypothetical protein O9H85_36120 [Paenibacillus filicis]|uniref:Uncharacterized protein n=1 Tax=Paenibacillus gyeongsangnamensis TaxID=3388067 RepID=A0ABT4QLT8_9BACL|nr:hypothetical protein [Paenibacillus filicis]MCZ8517656.1 hypothetical protein [Paenibacillus filicis]
MPIDWSGIMRKTGIGFILVICLTLLNPLLPTLNAKMTIYSPQDMIKNSDHILIGIIKKRKYEENYREVTISVETVLKGVLTQKEIVLSRVYRKDIINLSGVRFEFPKKGSKVMLLLKNYPNIGLSLTYANSICLMNNNKVSLYEGTEFVGNWKTTDYEKTYQTFYDKAVVIY